MNRLFWILFVALALATVAADIFLIHHHFWWSVPGFYIAFGFGGCLLLGLLAKFVGKPLLQKREDYYER